MNEQEKQEYLQKYKQAKKSGVPFFPDVVFKDAVVSLLVLLVLLGLILLAGVPLEARADPSDTQYTPRPEWYFLFLFQLLKYFPGELEVIGVFVIPTIFVALLFALPFLDRSRARHPFKRPYITGATTLVMAGVAFLTVQALLEAPPPAEGDQGDSVARLYAQNCSGCHGPNIEVPEGTDLHQVIAEGKHGLGMPAWSGDLTTNEIDALAGFISSPSGSALFSQYCADCHEAPELVASDPIQLKQALETGPAFEAHEQVDIPTWTEVMTAAERTDLLNFLVAPDGQRLFTVDCASCHGQSVSFSGDPAELRSIIEAGGLHLEMPPWQGRLDESQVEALAEYVVNPLENPQTEQLFRQNCSTCHGGLVPRASSLDNAVEIIRTGGPHQTMPVWGEVLTEAQIDALVDYTLEAARGTSVQVGRELYTQYCASCHGDFGEGGPNPTRPSDIIAPISSAEYLRTRDDFTLKAIISQGQPNIGMSPFATSNGGPLDADQIDAIVDYIRSWESNPPVELPPEVEVQALALEGAEIFGDLCAQCHGEQGQGLIGPSLVAADFQQNNTDEDIFETINEGHPATPMIGWGEVLTADQIQELVGFIRLLPDSGQREEGQAVSFQNDIRPIFERACTSCHGSLGGWDASTYQSIISTGDNAPVIVPGDPSNSLLAQKLQGTHTQGDIMPPSGKLPQAEIELILEWIEAGAENN
ncbi:MAG: c-type cytochrome [Anaerolineales bacterium]|nr:c-type cytochrome [Anaerolineales bacterium]